MLFNLAKPTSQLFVESLIPSQEFAVCLIKFAFDFTYLEYECQAVFLLGQSNFLVSLNNCVLLWKRSLLSVRGAAVANSTHEPKRAVKIT